ncbi:dirigent protein 4 [Telopea speciosissima]|uniref:dirigent protein 4 n=1 Tax=Telopea speciosissima TaxID=54955 RepID=UPI001CC4463C|nr:dirigent protein 4 [Telopea speciosissima]
MDMKEVMLAILCGLLLCLSTLPTHSAYYTEKLNHEEMKEKVTELHFFLHDTLSGKNPTAVLVAHSNNTNGDDLKSTTPFGSVYATNDPLTEGPELTSKVIGNAQGLYVSSGQDTLSLVLYVDFGFTTGEYNGSSISVFSRNPVTEGDRELAVVGGRNKFRMARGFANLKTQYLNVTNGDAVIEYKVTVFHY